MVRLVSMFNNKGGVGKTTLTFHLAHALAEKGVRVLLVDLDPQCNLTIFSLPTDTIHEIWQTEDPYVSGEGFHASRIAAGDSFGDVIAEPRSTHFLLKPTEDGEGDLPKLPPPVRLRENLDLLPGRLTLHTYEYKIASRFNDAYAGDALAIRTITRPRRIVEEYAALHNYDIAIVDTSPSLGALNKVAISTVDGFIIPCMPDMFSLYGIRNIGSALSEWKRQFDTIYTLISDEKRSAFPAHFVKFLGFTVYNAKRYRGVTEWDLARAHDHFAKQIPQTIETYIPDPFLSALSPASIGEPIGVTAVMHTHNTLPSMAQKYKCPMWLVPQAELDEEDLGTVRGNRASYEGTRAGYHEFAAAVLSRLEEVVSKR